MKTNKLVLFVLSILVLTSTTQATYAAPTPPQAPPGYTLKYIGQYSEVATISDGMIAVSNGKRDADGRTYYGFVDAETGKEVISPKFAVSSGSLHFYEGRASLHTAGGVMVIDKSGKTIVPAGKYDTISDYTKDGVALTHINRKGYGLIDKAGKEVLSAGGPVEIQAGAERYVDSGLLPVQIIGRAVTIGPGYSTCVSQGVIDITGKTIVPFSNTIYPKILENGIIEIYNSIAKTTHYIDKSGNKVSKSEPLSPPNYSNDYKWVISHKLLLVPSAAERANPMKSYIFNHSVLHFIHVNASTADKNTNELLKTLKDEFQYATPVQGGVSIIGQFVEWAFVNQSNKELNRPLCNWYILAPIK